MINIMVFSMNCKEIIIFCVYLTKRKRTTYWLMEQMKQLQDITRTVKVSTLEMGVENE